jgi:hypothetical protein
VGWRAKALIFEAPAVSLAASYHFELTAPEDLEILVAGFDFETRPGREPVEPAPDVADGPRVQHAHLNPPRVDPAYNASVFAALRAERAGFIPAACLTSLLVLALLLVGYVRLKSVSEPAQAQVVSPLLLIVPTIFAAFIIRPGEHRLASRVLVGARALLLLSVASAITAAGALAAGWHDSHLRHIWLVAMIVGAVAAVGLLATNVWPRAPRL